jgi:hypothetical protein
LAYDGSKGEKKLSELSLEGVYGELRGVEYEVGDLFKGLELLAFPLNGILKRCIEVWVETWVWPSRLAVASKYRSCVGIEKDQLNLFGAPLQLAKHVG